MIQSIRVGIYLLLLVVMVLAEILQDQFSNWELSRSFYIVALAGLLLHGTSFLFDKKTALKPRMLAATFVVDLLLISYLLYQTELNQTIFLFVYFVLILLSGVHFQTRGSMFMALGASLAWSVISLLGPDIKAFSFLFLLIVNNIAFFLVAWLSGFLSSQINVLSHRLHSQSLSLAAIEALNESIIESIPSGLISTDTDGEILVANPAAHKILQQKDLPGLNVFKFLPALKEKSLKPVFDIPFETDSGDRIILRCHKVDQLIIFDDLTEVRRLELALRQSEKMSAVGQLAAGIAHEIRNPLAGISGSLELLSQQFTTEDDKKLSRIILREIDRLNNLISEFLEFSKPEKPPVDLIDLESLFNDLKSTLSLQWKGSQKLNLTFKVETKIKVLGHRDKLQQAFLNILNNSMQAIEKSETPEINIFLGSKDQRCVVKIKDNGSGIPENILKRIFEPFMTTKSKGTGLGLAITHKILESHGAQVFVESNVSLGTEFTIIFPQAPSV